MIYLTIEEASNYIQKETGIRLLNQQFYDYSISNHLMLYINNRLVSDCNYWADPSHPYWRGLFSCHSDKVSKIRRKVFRLTSGYSPILSSYLGTRDNKGFIFIDYIYSKEAAIKYLSHCFMEARSQDNMTFSVGSEFRKVFPMHLLKGRQLLGGGLTTFQRDYEVIYDELERVVNLPSGKHLPVFTSLIRHEIDEEGGSRRMKVNLSNVFLQLKHVKHLSNCIKKGELAPNKDVLKIKLRWDNTEIDMDILEDKVEADIRERNTYLKIIRGFCEQQGIDINARGQGKRLMAACELAGYSVSERKARDIIKELKGLEE